MEHDEILALAHHNPEALVTFIQNQEEKIQRLEETVRLLEARIAELERQLTMNSRNSSRPPSTDGFKRPQKERTKTGKRPGGQKGHEGRTIEWCETPDEIQTHRASVCEDAVLLLTVFQPNLFRNGRCMIFRRHRSLLPSTTQRR